MKHTNHTFLLIACLVLSACGWDDGHDFEYGVWSDDGAAIAAVRHTFEYKNTVTHQKRRNYNVQVFVNDDAQSGTVSALSPALEGRVKALYYMRDAGYVILGRQGEATELSSGSDEALVAYDRIDMNGTVTSIASGVFTTMLSCDGGQSSTSTNSNLRVIPSPDGSVLAKFTSNTTCTSQVESVTFLDAATLEVFEGPIAIPSAPPNMGFPSFMWSPREAAWTENNTFIIGSWGNGAPVDSMYATVITLDGDVQSDVLMSNNCFWPATTSSDSGPSGTYINLDDNGGYALEPPMAEQSWLTFGCN
jgi:hypothetical protein